jgi:hypothetical protein
VTIEVCFETSMVAMRSQRKPIEVAGASLRVRLVTFDATCHTLADRHSQADAERPRRVGAGVAVGCVCDAAELPSALA